MLHISLMFSGVVRLKTMRSSAENAAAAAAMENVDAEIVECGTALMKRIECLWKDIGSSLKKFLTQTEIEFKWQIYGCGRRVLEQRTRCSQNSSRGFA